MKNKKLYICKLNVNTLEFENFELVIIHEFFNLDKKSYIYYRNDDKHIVGTVKEELINNFITDKNGENSLAFITDKKDNFLMVQCDLLNELKKLHIESINSAKKSIKKMNNIVKNIDNLIELTLNTFEFPNIEDEKINKEKMKIIN